MRSSSGRKMRGNPKKGGEPSDALAYKLDALSASVDTRFAKLAASLDQRFDAVDGGLIEQRQYTAFAFEGLRTELRAEMREGFGAVNERLDGHDSQFSGIGRRLDSIDGRFDRIDGRFDRIDGRFDRIDDPFDRIDDRFARIDDQFARIDDRFVSIDDQFASIDDRFNRLERKLDQFIDTQSRANQLVERRLAALEPRASQE